MYQDSDDPRIDIDIWSISYEALCCRSYPLLLCFVPLWVHNRYLGSGYLLDHILQSWWRHQMETFSALLAICAGNSPVSGEFTAQRPMTRSFDILFDLRFNKRLSKQSWGWWFETPPRSLWRHCNVLAIHPCMIWCLLISTEEPGSRTKNNKTKHEQNMREPHA